MVFYALRAAMVFLFPDNLRIIKRGHWIYVTARLGAPNRNRFISRFWGEREFQCEMEAGAETLQQRKFIMNFIGNLMKKNRRELFKHVIRNVLRRKWLAERKIEK